MPVPVAARSKAWYCDGSPAEIAVSNPPKENLRMSVMSVVSVMCCQVEVSATS